jgi:molecular chaperone DnaK
MPYVLGVDIGTSHTSAATCRLDEPRPGEVDIVALGMRSDTMASAVYVGPDGTVVVGDQAQRYAPTEPTSVANGFLRRMGDDIPLMVGGEPCTPQDLIAALVMWVAEQAAVERGDHAEHIVVTHPASWGSYRRMLLHQALRQAGLSNVTLLPEPIAVGEGYAMRNPVDSGATFAVYGLGATRFTTSVIRRTEAGTFELLGHADAAEPLGGENFDDLVFDHVRGKLDHALDDLDPADPRTRFEIARLRRECLEAKHRLSTQRETTIRVQLPDLHTQIPLTRAELENLITPTVESTVDTLTRTVRKAGDRLDAVLLVGGSAGIPLITTMVSAAVSAKVRLDGDPQLAMASSAALAAMRFVAGHEPPGVGTMLQDAGAPPSSTELTSVVVMTDNEDDQDDEPPPRPALDITPPDLPQPPSPMRRFSRNKSGAVGAAAVIALAGGIWLTFALRGGTTEQQQPAEIPALVNTTTSTESEPQLPTADTPSASTPPSTDNDTSEHEQDKDGR